MTASTTQQARNFTKMRRASEQFAKVSFYGDSLVQRLTRHCNGNPQEPHRKLHKFVEHNTADELVQIALMSEEARRQSRTDGYKRELCHLVPLNRASQAKKVNNVSNLAVLTQETNRLVNKKAVTRKGAEAIDALVLAGKFSEARELAAICTF
jgi:hypothetical protein